jgi:hypothetical protein
MAKSAPQQLRDLADLEEAIESSAEPNMSWEELTKALGLPVGTNGQPNMVDLFNACWHVQSNPAVQALPTQERIRVIRSAADAMSYLRSGN